MVTEAVAPTAAPARLRIVAVRAAPAAAVAVTALVLAWRTQGSLRSPAWLPGAVIAALVLATVLAAGVAVIPARSTLIGLAGLSALAAYAAISIAWSPSPAGARDEAVLVALYAVVFSIPLLSVRTPEERLLALELTLAGLVVVAIATCIALLVANDPLTLYYGGRLNRPISYPNATALLFALGFWPAVAIASRKRQHPALRVAASGAATLFVMLVLAAQSKGALLGLVVSAIVTFAFVPYRLRFVVPAATTAVVGAVAFSPLTAPYRATTTAGGVAAVHRVAIVALVAAAVAALLGFAQARVDRRVTISARTNRRVGTILVGAVALVVTAALALFLTHHPGRWVSGKWESFKHIDTSTGGTTHLLSLGSARYDVWRVALDEFTHHPLAGIGARGFYSAYLRLGRTPETPLRAHSLYFDTLSEGGLIGALLLLAAIGVPLMLLARRRRSLTTAATFAAAIVFLVHAGVDWMWTVPPVGMLFFLLLGLGAAGQGDERPLPRAGARAGAVVAVLLAALVFAPPWLADRYVVAAYRSPSVAARDLRWARRLDPLSLDPFFARWRLASTPQARIAALEDARAVAPDDVASAFQLGLAQLAAGHRSAAVATLEDARRLDPRDPAVAQALAQARG